MKPYFKITDLSVSSLNDPKEVSEITKIINSPEMRELAFNALVLLKRAVKNDRELNALVLTLVETKTGNISKQHDGIPYSEIPDLEG